MLDIRQIAQNPDAWRVRLARRGGAEHIDAALALDARRRECIQRGDSLRHEKAQTEKGMRTADKKGPEFAAFRDRMRSIGQEIKAVAEEQRQAEAELAAFMLTIPNAPDDVVPTGNDEADNAVLRVVGQKPQLDFEPKQHWDLGEDLGLLDFERGAKVTGTRFTVYKGALARMERALAAFMLDMHTTEHGYTEVLPPFMVNADSMQGTGQFPKFKDDAFAVSDDYYLVPTAEVPVTNLHRDEIIELPQKYTAWTPCFRREAGGYGRDTRGLIRQHQFQKVELVWFCAADESEAAHEALTGHAEAILQALGLHYRVVDLCTGDLGFSAARTFDLEVWLPGQNAYREISSCSNFRDFQARRAKIRHRVEGQKKPQLVHTLNGSGLAVGRTVVAILENYQQADGRIRVPEALRGYMGGLEFIG